MNRPKLEDFYNQDKFYKVRELVPIYVNMIDALEKYCDFLEDANKCYGEVYSECEMYKKAFNLAIKEIVKHHDKYPMPLGDQYKYYKNKFLKEVNNE